MYDYSKLKGRIVEKYGTLGDFAKEVGICRESLSNKLNNKTDISRSEIELWMRKLSINASDIYDFFFCTRS